MHRYDDKLAPFITGGDFCELEPTDPNRFDDLELKEREASYGRSGFALQFMLDTTLSDKERYPLKLSDLIVMDINNDIAPVKCTGLSGGYTEVNLTKIATMARDAKVNMIIVESNFGDGMFTQLLKPIVQRYYPVTIEEVNHTKQKELRIIDTLEPVMNQHRLVVSPQLVRKDFDTKDPNYQLFYQMTRLTKDRGSLRNDDRLDALSIAVAYWVEQMAVDADNQIQDHRDNRLKQDLETFLEGTLGQSKKGDLWF